jgi:hypothetical protein
VICDNGRFHRYEQSLEELKVSAKQGCDLCRFLLHCILSHTRERKGRIWMSVHPQTGLQAVVESLLVRTGHDTIHLRLLTPRGEGFYACGVAALGSRI